MKAFILALSGLIFISCVHQNKPQYEASTLEKPNIIYILADDLGYGDLSSYGQTKFSTPNIDKLAADGMLFNQHYSGATVCAPSRSVLMTGYHSGHTPVRGNKEVKPEGQWPLPADTYTLAEMLQKNGYVTGAFGKWGLGFPDSEGDPMKQGFDRFYGYNCQRLGHNYYPYYLWNNDQKNMLVGNEGMKKEEYAPNLIHQQAISFLEKNKNKPFFMYYPSIIPHAELVAPKEYMDKYLGKYEPEKKFKGKDGGENYRMGGYESQENSHAAFVAMIHLLDDQVGEIVAKVKELGIEENTLIIFTSDNGPHKEGGADPDYFNSNGIFRGYKRDLYEGGIRVPMIAKWKGMIKEGSVSDHISAFWDIFPTVAEMINAEVDDHIDGISLLPTFLGIGDQKQHSHLYWEFHERGGRQAIRQGDWKLVKYDVNKNGEYQLYNLKTDPGETKDIAQEHTAKLNDLIKILESSRTESEVYSFIRN